MAGRKRRASDMDSRESVSKPTLNGSRRSSTAARSNTQAKSKKKRGRPAGKGKTSAKPESGGAGDILFTVECPVRPESKQYITRAEKENWAADKDTPPLAGAEHLKIAYAVKPGSNWERLPRFKNAKCEYPSFK
jgi:hypothetical protein